MERNLNIGGENYMGDFEEISMGGDITMGIS